MRTSRMRLLGLGFLRRGFLRDAMLGLGELLFELGDFIGFDVGGQRALPFHERFFPFGGGHLGAAGLGVQIAEMRVDSGVVAFVLEGFAQSGFGIRRTYFA